jgi:hypothetical protein
VKEDEGEKTWGGERVGRYDVLSSSRSVLRERERDRQNCDRLSAENIAG